MIALIALAAVAAGLLAACGDDDGYGGTATSTTAARATVGTAAATASVSGAAAASPTVPGSLLEVEVSDNKYTPSNLTVPAGSKVTWVWTGQRTHSVEGSFGGQTVASEKQNGGRFSFTFATKGTFDYQCGVHGAAMSAKVTVQ
jgi:plastocyanin